MESGSLSPIINVKFSSSIKLIYKNTSFHLYFVTVYNFIFDLYLIEIKGDTRLSVFESLQKRLQLKKTKPISVAERSKPGSLFIQKKNREKCQNKKESLIKLQTLKLNVRFFTT